MKSIISIFCSILISFQLTAQTAQYDVVLMANGEEKEGKVTGISDDGITFIHSGETLTYTLKKSDIVKITFSSGRIEFFNKAGMPGSGIQTQGVAAGLMDHHNKVAILPFEYLIDKQPAGEALSNEVQREAYAFLSNHIGALQLQEPVTTDALLVKAGIDGPVIKGYTMGEICNILGVEYVIQGIVNQDRVANVTSTFSSDSYNREDRSDSNKWNSNDRSVRETDAHSSSTVRRDNYETSILLNVYKDNGTSIFNKEHESIWNTDDAYKVTLKYLLKRIPIYRK